MLVVIVDETLTYAIILPRKIVVFQRFHGEVVSVDFGVDGSSGFSSGCLDCCIFGFVRRLRPLVIIDYLSVGQ